MRLLTSLLVQRNGLGDPPNRQQMTQNIFHFGLSCRIRPKLQRSGGLEQGPDMMAKYTEQVRVLTPLLNNDVVAHHLTN